MKMNQVEEKETFGRGTGWEGDRRGEHEGRTSSWTAAAVLAVYKVALLSWAKLCVKSAMECYTIDLLKIRHLALKPDQKLAMCCRVKYCTKNLLQRRVARQRFFVQQLCARNRRCKLSRITPPLETFRSEYEYKISSTSTLIQANALSRGRDLNQGRPLDNEFAGKSAGALTSRTRTPSDLNGPIVIICSHQHHQLSLPLILLSPYHQNIDPNASMVS